MPQDISACYKFIFLISQPKHMLWVLKRTVIETFLERPKTHVLSDGQENNKHLHYLDLCTATVFILLVANHCPKVRWK